MLWETDPQIKPAPNLRILYETTSSKIWWIPNILKQFQKKELLSQDRTYNWWCFMSRNEILTWDCTTIFKLCVLGTQLMKGLHGWVQGQIFFVQGSVLCRFSLTFFYTIKLLFFPWIKQYSTYRTNPTIYLQYSLEHCCDLWTTRKRKGKDQLGDLCKDILCIVNKTIGETKEDLFCKFKYVVSVRSNVSSLQVNITLSTISIAHRLLHKLPN